MILEELVGLVVSFAPLFISQPLHTSSQNPQIESTESTSHEKQQTSQRETFWADKIHREYDQEDERELLQAAYYDDSVVCHVPVDKKPSFLESLRRSLLANIGIMILLIPLGLLSMFLVYFEMKTSELCIESKNNNNKTIPISVTRWQLIGEDIESIPLNIWFPVTLALIFGWKEFKSNYISTLYVGVAIGATVVIYKTYLFIFHVYKAKMSYRYPGNALFIAGIICSSILVARKFRKTYPSTTYSSVYITVMISFGAVAGFVIAMIYRYFIVPYFNGLEDGINKAIMAAITPAVAVIPTAICKYVALRRSSEMIRQDRSFIYFYFLRGAAIALYRIMQANFKNIWLFVALSLVHGLSNVSSKATERLREKLWIHLITCLKRTCCGRRVHLLPLNTPHHRRIKADLEIQNILFEYTTLILSQAYLVLYLITNFYISPWAVIKGSLIRMAIGLGIDFFFNCISVFIQIHYRNVPMRRVWLKCWKRHVISNAIVIMLCVFYFTSVLLTVFQVRGDKKTQEYAIRNCTLPFESWYEIIYIYYRGIY